MSRVSDSRISSGTIAIETMIRQARDINRDFGGWNAGHGSGKRPVDPAVTVDAGASPQRLGQAEDGLPTAPAGGRRPRPCRRLPTEGGPRLSGGQRTRIQTQGGKSISGRAFELSCVEGRAQGELPQPPKTAQVRLNGYPRHTLYKQLSRVGVFQKNSSTRPAVPYPSIAPSGSSQCPFLS